MEEGVKGFPIEFELYDSARYGRFELGKWGEDREVLYRTEFSFLRFFEYWDDSSIFEWEVEPYGSKTFESVEEYDHLPFWKWFRE